MPLRVSIVGLLADLNVLGLRLRDLDFRFQPRRIGDAREVRARRDLLADFDRHDLENAVHAGAHLQVVALLTGQREQGTCLVDSGLLDRELRAARVRATRQLFLSDLVSDAKLLRIHLGLPERQRRHQPVLRQRLVHLRLHLGLVEVGFDAGRDGPLLQQVVLHLHAQVCQGGLGGLELQLGVEELLFELGITQLEDDAVWLHRGARPEDDVFDPRLGRGGNPADVFGDERAQAAHFAQQRTALDRVDPDRRALDARARLA